MQSSSVLLLVAAGVLLSSSDALAQVTPAASFAEIDGDYGSIIFDTKPKAANSPELDAYEVTDVGVTTWGRRDYELCSQWSHERYAPYMGSQSYTMSCPGSTESVRRTEQMLVNDWYPGTDSRRTISLAMRVRNLADGVAGSGFFMQLRQDNHSPAFRLKWVSDENGNLIVDGFVLRDRLEGNTSVYEYERIFEVPIEEDVWQRFMVSIDPGPATGSEECPQGLGDNGTITVWKMNNATGEWEQPMPTYHGRIGFLWRAGTDDCLAGADLSYQVKVGEYSVQKDNTLDLDNVSYGKRWNDITKNRLVGYKKSVLRLRFEETGTSVYDDSWTWNGGVAGDPTRDYDNDGTISGTAARTMDDPVNGKNLYLNGSSHVTVPIDPVDFDLGNYMTVSTWFKTQDLTDVNRGLVMIDEYSTNWKVLLYASNRGVSYGVKHPGGAYSRLDHIVPLNQYNDNKWHHVAATFNRFAADGKRIKLYIDGIKVMEREGLDLPIIRGEQRLVVGKFTTANFFKGFLDDVGLFNYAMTEEDVESLYLERGAP